MTETRRCERCGAPLAAGGELEGLCPACLMKGAEATVATERIEPEPDPLSLEEVRRRFPNLEIEERIGRGGMGVVYKARQVRLDRTVALKVMDPELARDPSFAERFQREARVLARLSHPNVVSVHDFGEVDGHFYLLMEYVDGTNLREVLRSGGLSPSEALGLVPEICAGLQYAHDHGVVHRDIKPENILLDAEGRAKIADFGIAKLREDGPGGAGAPGSLTRSFHVMGTPHYMAPEQVATPKSVDHRADIYSLGVVLYEMLTRELPVGHFPPPSQRVAVDVRLDEVILKALEREPARRYQQVREVDSAVSGASDAGGANARAGAVGANGPDDAEPRWLALVPGGPLAVAGAALLLGAAWLAISLPRLPDHLVEAHAAAYPLFFLAWIATRVRAAAAAPLPARLALGLAGLAGAAASSAFSAGAYVGGRAGGTWILEGLAGVLVVLAHLLLDRFVRAGTRVLLVGVVALLLVATLLHASRAPFPANEAFYYASGMVALIGGASLAVQLGELAAPTTAPALGPRLARAFAVALLGALAYFHDHLF